MSGARSGDDIVIAPASPDDAPALHDMLRRLGAALNRADEIRSSPDDIARYGFGPSPAFEAVVARRQGIAVGMAIYFYEFSTWRGSPGVYVQDLFVAEAMRGTGLGRRLLAAVAARGTMRGAVYMRLSVHDGNDAGNGFYERLGFEAPHERGLVLDGTAFAALGGRPR